MRTLDVVPDIVYGHNRKPIDSVSLRKLEEALANISAAMYWAGASLPVSSSNS